MNSGVSVGDVRRWSDFEKRQSFMLGHPTSTPKSQFVQLFTNIGYAVKLLLNSTSSNMYNSSSTLFFGTFGKIGAMSHRQAQ
jgi:hypothetical protein